MWRGYYIRKYVFNYYSERDILKYYKLKMKLLGTFIYICKLFFRIYEI